MLGWAFTGASTLTVQGIGFWLSIAGTIISIVGFWITIKQLIETKRATVAVRDELERVKASINYYDANREVAKASQSLNNAKKYLDSRNWLEVANSYEEYVSSMHIVQQLALDYVVQFKDDIDQSLDYAKRLCERIDEGTDEIGRIEIPRTKSRIRDHELLLSSVDIAMQGKAIK